MDRIHHIVSYLFANSNNNMNMINRPNVNGSQMYNPGLVNNVPQNNIFAQNNLFQQNRMNAIDNTFSINNPNYNLAMTNFQNMDNLMRNAFTSLGNVWNKG